MAEREGVGRARGTMRSRIGGAHATVALLLALCVVAGCSTSSKHASPPSSSTLRAATARNPNTFVAVPTVTGPISGGQPDIPMNAMLASYRTQFGYSEREYFIEGIATAYRAAGPLGEDGRWTVTPGPKAAYKTRILVRVPNDPAKFNGTVVLEWLNVTSGRDSDPDFGFAAPELLRDGFAYVGVTAQQGGVGGGAGFTLPIPGYHPKPLIIQNPQRYNGLHHPGDDYSYDIFSQAAQAILQPSGPLAPLHPAHLIADGESQSAFRLVTYANAVAPMTNIFDGILIHSRGGSGEALDQSASKQLPKIAHIRTDLRIPVLMISTETDLFGLGFSAAIQPDTRFLRTWQMAGTSHVDQSTIDYGVASGRQWDTTSIVPDFTGLCGSVNDGPQRYIVRAAFASLDAWIIDGTAPPQSPALEVKGSATIVRDTRGIALGGIRTPAVDVPIETLSGDFAPGKSIICSLFGSRTPFNAEALSSLYPTHADYATKVKASTEAAVKAGFVLRSDAAEIEQAAQDARVFS